MFLEKELFSSIIANAPLISIDLVIKDSEGKVLLGKRINKPAKNSWFVPGGRIFKDESLDDAFIRTVKEELGLNIERKDAIFDKTYEHFYENNVFDDKFSTHYIVLAHKIKIDNLPILNNQHSDYKWFEVDELLQDKNVHKYTKDYFI